MRGRRKADEQQARIRIAEAGDRPSPVDVIAMRALLLPCDALAVLPQTRAAFAGDDGVMDVGEMLQRLSI